ncbi:MAG: WYL domain-containing protein [Bacteroidota bacterium]
MSLNKYAAIRYRIIDQCIRSRSKAFPSKEYLRQACEEALYGSSTGQNISLSTIDKDIWAMKNESALGYAPVVFDRQKGGYYYSDPEFSINLPLTSEDVELIRLALQTLTHFKNSQIFRDLENAVDKIQGRISLADRFTGTNLDRIIQFESSTLSSGQEHLPVLLDSIKDKREIEFDYTPYIDGRPRHYIYQPYLLKENKNLWYLVGRDVDQDKIRTLGLDRISCIKVTDNTFYPDKNFDPEQFFLYSFGIGTYSGVPEAIILKADPVQARYILASPLHPTQQAKVNEDGFTDFHLTVIPSDELRMQILSYGPRVEVLSPGWLREEIRENLTKALENYSE